MRFSTLATLVFLVSSTAALPLSTEIATQPLGTMKLNGIADELAGAAAWDSQSASVVNKRNKLDPGKESLWDVLGALVLGPIGVGAAEGIQRLAAKGQNQTVGNPGPTFDFRHAKRDLGITSSPRNLVPETAQSIPEAQDLSIGGRPEPLRTYKLRTPSKTLRAVQLEEHAFAALAPMIQSPPSPSYTSIFAEEPVIPQHSRSSSPLPPGPSDMVVSPDDGRGWSVSESRDLDEGLETPSNSSATSATLKSDAQSLAASYRIVPQEEPLQGQQGQKFYTAVFTPVSALANLSLPSAAPLDTRTLDEDIACMLDSFNANDDSHVTHLVDPIVSDILDACEGDGLNLDDILDGYSVCPPSTETQPALQARQSRVSPPSQSPSHPKADDMQADEQDLNSCPKWSPRMPPDSPRPTGILEPVSPVDHMDGTLLAVNIPETANRSPSPAPSGEMVMLSRALSPPQDQPSLVHSDGRLLGPSLFPDDVSDEDL
ncbi:hypothetical protein FRB99_005989 [Tulasnella sp. 403]|nr:hypothetical protein FRB99_005989 [Tulasnella sp. 403]